MSVGATDVAIESAEYVLKRVYQDYVNGKINNTVASSEQAFLEHYNEDRIHDTLCTAHMRIDFYRGGRYNETLVMSKEKLARFRRINPEINLGEADGKHSEVIRKFNEFYRGGSDEYYEVYEHSNGYAYSDSVPDEWDEALEVAEECAAKRAKTK